MWEVNNIYVITSAVYSVDYAEKQYTIIYVYLNVHQLQTIVDK